MKNFFQITDFRYFQFHYLFTELDVFGQNYGQLYFWVLYLFLIEIFLNFVFTSHSLVNLKL